MKRILMLAALCAVAPLGAATLTVTNLNDIGAGSLRQACTDAVSGDTIVFQTGLAGTITFGSQINLGSKVLTIVGNADGSGAPVVILDGNASTRILSCGANLTLQALTLTNGSSPAGGAIVATAFATVSCAGCRFIGNTAQAGGAICNLAGINLTVICTACVFSANTAVDTSGGNAQAGAVRCTSLTCTNCSFVGNSTAGQNVIGGAIEGVSIDLSNCTFSANQASSYVTGTVEAGAIRAHGSLTANNCTFTNNGAASAMFGYGGALFLDANSSLINCTFSGNYATHGRCILMIGTVTVINCIFADTGTGSMFDTRFGVMTSGGYNICTAAAGDVPWLNATGDQPGTNPLLGGLQGNGGPVATMLPAFNSPAIDKGGGTTTTTDTRGIGRPIDNAAIANATGGDGRDIGAVEFVFNSAPVITAPAALNIARDSAYTFSGTVSVADADAGGGDLEVALTATNGTLTLSSTTGLTFTTGDGIADATMTFTGTLAIINAAVNGMTFTPTAAYVGAASLQVDADDQGNSGDNGALADSETIALMVVELPEITLLRGGVEIASGGGDNAWGPAGTAITRTYTIRNDGIAVLNVGGVTFANESNCAVTLTTPPGATVAPGATSDFTIAITPVAAGSFSLDFAIASDDADENPYTVTVVGTATAAQSGGGGGGGGDDDDASCSTGTTSGLGWLALIAAIATLAARTRRAL